MILPIKRLLLETTGAALNYNNLVPKKSIPRNNPILPSENASRLEVVKKSTSIGEPTSDIATKAIEIKTKELAKAIPE